MTRFITTQPLRLTPLTPIHIGCGIDFEPTNYVIDEEVLYHFDPAQEALSAQDRKALIDACNDREAALRRIQGFFHDRKDRYKARARHVVPVAAGVAEQHGKRIRQIAQKEADGRNVINLLEIERTMHHPHSGVPYLPGSSLKGAMRTAWLDHLNRGRARTHEDRNANALEKRLLEGAFHTDPFRLVDVADASGPEVASKVYFSTNHKKRQVFKDGQELQGKGPATRREALVGGQHAVMHSEVRLDRLPGLARHPLTPAEHQRFDLNALAAACNRYYVPRLHRLLALLENRGFSDPAWITGIRRLLDDLGAALDSGQAFLLRVGRHSGAESVTLDGVREIRIMQGRGMPARQSDESTTVWLAAETEHTTRGGLLPFGWLLVERADVPEVPALRMWCDRQPKPDLAAILAKLHEARAKAQAEAAEAERLDIERRAAAERAERAAAEAAERLTRMTPNLRDVEQLATALRQRIEVLRGGKDKPNTECHTKARALAKRALSEDWPQVERVALADMLEKTLPQVVQIDWKDERKKMQVGALRA